jgi:hypothetical protein
MTGRDKQIYETINGVQGDSGRLIYMWTLDKAYCDVGLNKGCEVLAMSGYHQWTPHTRAMSIVGSHTIVCGIFQHVCKSPAKYSRPNLDLAGFEIPSDPDLFQSDLQVKNHRLNCKSPGLTRTC